MSEFPYWASRHTRTTIEDYLNQALSYIDEVLPQLNSYEPEPSVDDSEYYVVSEARYANLVRAIGSSLGSAKFALWGVEQKINESIRKKK